MNPLINEIEEALSTVEATIDRLRKLGHEETAFNLAKLQFSAAIRASWPGNLAPLAVGLSRVLKEEGTGLDEGERERLSRAAETFKKLCNL